VIPSDGYLAEAQKLLHKHNALLIADEVQTGLCRTGEHMALLVGQSLLLLVLLHGSGRGHELPLKEPNVAHYHGHCGLVWIQTQPHVWALIGGLSRSTRCRSISSSRQYTSVKMHQQRMLALQGV
jgi:hypothetical protein